MFLRRVVAFSVVFILLASCKSKKSASTTGATGTTYLVGGTISGLVGTVVLQNNSGNNLSVSSSGSFQFSTGLSASTAYSVTVLTEPSGQHCAVSSGSGTISADVSDVSIVCNYQPVTTNCDSGLDIDSQDATEAADALGICEGVTTANWELPAGGVTATAPVVDVTTLPAYHLGHGILTNFGPNVLPPEGSAMLALSTGTARASAHPGYVSPYSAGYDKGYAALFPTLPGIPSSGDQPSGACTTPDGSTSKDGVSLKVRLTVPAGANAFRFWYKFYGADFPTYKCTSYVDTAAIIVNSSTLTNQNILLSSHGNVLNVNSSDISVCDPYGGNLCPMGTSELVGTGFENTGATGWTRSSGVSVTPGETVDVQFMIWDTLDGTSDSTLLLDSFEWYSN